jgi:NAD(P)-dependent dehydrogenase (short-subunit alcohol dehydrogenase family)
MLKVSMAKSVVITGASTGIGRASALTMDRLGWQVFAGVRRKSDAASLRAESSDLLLPVILDVTDRESIQAALQVVSERVGTSGLGGLINNAGIPYGGPVEYLSLDEVRREFEVNFFGVIAVTQAFLPLLRRGSGRIVNMSSVAGMLATPFLSSYSATKFALEALSDCLRIELKPWHIQVSVIQPGAIDTPIWSKGRKILDDLINRAPPEGLELYGSAISNMKFLIAPHGASTEVAARAVAHALASARPRTRYAIGFEGALMRFVSRLPDGLRDRLILSRLPKWG